MIVFDAERMDRMEKRSLGRTGHMSTVVILGTAAFWAIDQDGANQALDLIRARGVNHIDVAPQYGNAQQVLGPWLESRRDQFFVGCKTLERTRDAAWNDLQNSFKLVRTDHFDLYQFHAVCTMEDLDQISAADGAIHTFTRARDEGLVRNLGITSHGMFAPRVALTAVERFDLNTVMFPINPRLYADADYRRDAERLLDVCQQRGVGAQIIKSVAKQPWRGREKTYNPWYEPYDTYEDIASSVHFALSQPGVTAVVSMGDVSLLPVFIDAADRFAPMNQADQAALIAQRAENDLIFDGPRGVN
jgi:aryl-alcohol dehydrogenase-like predicted oxidoreductase